MFLIGYTPTGWDESSPPTAFYVVTRQVKGPFIYQKLPDAFPPYGINRSPPHFFMQRLKNFPPNLQDLIVVASTTSADIGMFTRAQTPLMTESAPDNIINVFTTTMMAIDSRRAQLPMTETMEDTSPIGTVIDLSAKEKVLRPLPGEEMDSSPGPVPALMVLNNEGILSAWWIIYADSIRQGTKFPGLVFEGSQAPSQPQNNSRPTAFDSTNSQSPPVFGQTEKLAPTSTSFGVASKPAPSSFGGGSSVGPSTSSAFGAPSAPASSPSPWTSSGFTTTNSQTGSSSFGKPSFGSSTTMGALSAGPAFGAAGGFAKNASPWGTAGSGAPSTGGSVFGQSGGLGMRGPVLGAPTTSGIFGSGSSTEPSQGGFASFAKGTGFLASPSQGESKSLFAKASIGPPPSSTMDTDMPFGGVPQKNEGAPKGLLSTSGFTLGSTFTGEETDIKGSSKPMDNKKSSLFGDSFSTALGEVQKDTPAAQSKEATMTEDDSDMAGSESSEEPPTRGARTPLAKSVQPQTQVTTTSTPKTGELFRTQSQTTSTPAAVQSSVPAPPIFGKQAPPTTTPAETPQKQSESPHDSQTPPSPTIKPEPGDQETPVGVSKFIPEAPLPPESTSKVSYAPGDSSSSSKSSAEDAPLPPDWSPSKTKLRSVEKPPEDSEESPDDGDDAPLPPDVLPSKTKSIISESEAEQEPELPSDGEDDGLDDEGSGIDVAQEISPTSDPRESPRFTPGSSFGPSLGPSPLGGVFSKVQPPRQSVKSLFGEVSQTGVPILPPPSRTQESPRSPSPVRLVAPDGGLRPDNARSISAPMQPHNTTARQRSAIPSTSISIANVRDQRHKDKHAVWAAQQARQQAEEEQDLSDREDEKVREELENEVEATKTLDDFLAHQDYIGTVTKPGIPGQIEKVYRDVNSMVDTLGLNARSLQGFVKGHETLAKNGGKSIEDLADDDWCLIEIDDLVSLEGQIEDQLSKGRLVDVQGKLDACRELRNDLAKLRKRRTDLGRTIEAIPGGEEANALKYAPLSADQSSKQIELRKGYTRVQKLVAEAEEKITLLRARLASLDTSEGRTGTTKKPTVEAVTATINKMTSMVEKRSGDIDFLEAQMQKLRFTPVDQDSSREGSPLANGPTTTKMPSVKTLQTTVSGLIESPNSNLRRSTGDGGTPRRRMSGITPEEVSTYRTKVQRRREVNQIMREAFAKAGPRVRTLE